MEVSNRTPLSWPTTWGPATFSFQRESVLRSTQTGLRPGRASRSAEHRPTTAEESASLERAMSPALPREEQTNPRLITPAEPYPPQLPWPTIPLVPLQPISESRSRQIPAGRPLINDASEPSSGVQPYHDSPAPPSHQSSPYRVATKTVVKLTSVCQKLKATARSTSVANSQLLNYDNVAVGNYRNYLYKSNSGTDTELRHELVFNFGTDRCEDLAVRIARHSHPFGGMSLTQPVQDVDHFTAQMDRTVRSLNDKYVHIVR
ncbi:hypothetical protein IWQ60_004173 [Tieghemiomyces parasiticus]|uniref:Uncharacterized protein n=1 Tax=Tieghemiomyces parasiticus TaxID=78921 RepID=A0A9W8DZD4_9FUNG|nr:hypothetical protein IWQ60_004173 [Tieghemiomyces parasiticus]